MAPPLRLRPALSALAGLAVISLAGSAVGQAPALPAHPVDTTTPALLLAQPVAATTPNADQVRLGQQLVIAGDCMSCHLRERGQPFAGGLALKTPFGTLYSANITSDPQTGIGGWTPEQFHQAMHNGVDNSGANLYPALPYPWFTRISRAEDDAILAYLKTTTPVRYTPPANKLPFPINIRFMVKFWNLLFFKPGYFQPTAGQSAEWNRGAYLVTGPGHCGGCHTTKNFLGADKAGHILQGGDLDNWTAPDLTSNPRTGLGRWTVDDITEFLKTGRNVHAAAGGGMADVVSYSTALMSDADRHAIAVYLKSVPASPDPAIPAPDAASLKRGAAIYSDVCASCHLDYGVGQPHVFPPLIQNAVAQQNDPMGLEHLILAGSRVATTAAQPTPLTMPSFAWKLTDQQIADVATYVRNSWGNHAAPLTATRVHDARHKLGLDKPRLTVNSGDQG
jgi:mono/diheme cytochrome c family protein